VNITRVLQLHASGFTVLLTGCAITFRPRCQFNLLLGLPLFPAPRVLPDCPLPSLYNDDTAVPSHTLMLTCDSQATTAHPSPAFCRVFYRDARTAELAAAQAATTVDEAQVQALQAARSALKAEQVGNTDAAEALCNDADWGVLCNDADWGVL